MEYAEFRELTTPRLILRRITREDVPFYFSRLFGSAQVAKYMNWEPHNHISQSEVAVEKVLARYAAGKYYRWGIALPDGNSLIGIIELLKFDEEANTCSFAYMLGADHWGKGYGAEALTASIDFAFTDLKVDAIIADHMAPNLASGRAMQKAGMTYVRTFPQQYAKNGEVYDLIQYRITRQQWVNRR